MATPSAGAMLSYAISLRSKKRYISLAANRVSKILDKNGYSQDDLCNIGLCISEAVVNAMKHGNNYNPDKKANLQLELYQDRVEIYVTDEGTQRFDFESALKEECERTADSQKAHIDNHTVIGDWRSGMGLEMVTGILKLNGGSYNVSDINNEDGSKKGTRVHIIYKKDLHPEESHQLEH